MNSSMVKHIIARVEFYATNEGGKSLPLTGDLYRCLAFIKNGYHDCTLFIEKKCINPGDIITISINFLYPDDVLKKIDVGDQFYLWEGKYIADCEVLEITVNPGESKNKGQES